MYFSGIHYFKGPLTLTLLSSTEPNPSGPLASLRVHYKKTGLWNSGLVPL